MKALEEIKARLEAATPGPWKVSECSPCTRRGRLDVTVWANSGNALVANWCDDDEYYAANAELIANAPETQAKLIAALEAVMSLADDAVTNLAYNAGGMHLADRINAAIAEALA